MQERLADEGIRVHTGRLMVSGGVGAVKETGRAPPTFAQQAAAFEPMAPGLPSSRTGLLPSSPLRTVHESFPSHSSSPSNASFRETRFRDRNSLAMNPVMALWMK